MKDNLRTVNIVNAHGNLLEVVKLRINRKTFHPGCRFQGIRNKMSMAAVNLIFVKEDFGVLIAKKSKK